MKKESGSADGGGGDDTTAEGVVVITEECCHPDRVLGSRVLPRYFSHLSRIVQGKHV